MLEFQELQNDSPPRDRPFYLIYFLAKLWLSCDIQHLTPLTFNSNSPCLELEHAAVCHLNRRVLSWEQI